MADLWNHPGAHSVAPSRKGAVFSSTCFASDSATSVVNVVIVHYSVEWWSSLHQGQTLMKKGGPGMDADMLYPLLAMILGFTLIFGALLARRIRTVSLAAGKEVFATGIWALGAYAVAALSLAPYATAAALRISNE